MTDRPAPDTRQPYFNDPDAQNVEQSEAGTQAQDVAADAQNASADQSEESERGGHSDPGQIIPDDTPDLVETMNAMVRSGHIDRDAFAGEDNMDEENIDE